MAAVKYWIWLSSLGVSPRRVSELLLSFGSPEALYFAGEEQLRETEGVTSEELSRLTNRSLERAKVIWEDCYRENIRILTLGDAEYPDRLRNIYDPPVVLYVRGQLPPVQELPTLAVVGTRHATGYGRRATHAVCRELAASGMLLVSGMALGIDAAAHQGALDVGSPTLAVLGCGVDIIYPRQNEALYREICETGAVLSEYPPGTPPLGVHFPVRNRILSGLSDGILVGQAPKKSGALITARLALEQGRQVFFLPGNIDEPQNEGSNALGLDGGQMATCAADILREYLPLYPDSFRLGRRRAPERVPQATGEQAVPPPRASEAPAERVLSPAQRTIVEKLQYEQVHIDDLITRTGLPPSQVLSELTLLEMDGVVRQLPGKHFVLV